MRIPRLCSALALVAAASIGPGASAAPAEVAWTVVLYFDGDGPVDSPSLEAAVVDRVRSVLGAAPHPDVHVLALVDRQAGGDDSTVRVPPHGEVRWSGAKLLLLQDGYADEIRPEAESNLADAATLTEVLRIAREDYPARRYALALKSHGAADGWLCSDRSLESGSSDVLEISELQQALKTFAAARGAPLDLLVLDACGMATVDTLAALGPYADAFAASSDLLFARSVPYRALVDVLQGGEVSDGRRAASLLVERYPEGGAPGGNAPAGCPPEPVYGVLAAIPTSAVARLHAAYELMARFATASLSTDGGAQRLGVARQRAFTSFASMETHFDALAVAEAIEANAADAELRWAAAAAAEAAREVAATSRHGADLSGTCGISVCWPCEINQHLYVQNPLWFTHGWREFVKTFLDAMPGCGGATANGNDLTTSVQDGSTATVTTRHGGGLEAAAPSVGHRQFVVTREPEPDTDESLAMFRVPFSGPPLIDGELSQSAEFRNRWAYGRMVFVGESTTPGGPGFVECPIEWVQPVAAWDGDGPASCAARTGQVHVTLPPAMGSPEPGWSGEVTLRVVLKQSPRLPFVVFRPDLQRQPGWPLRTPWPWLSWRRLGAPWTARVIFAYAAGGSSAPDVPVPLSTVVGPGGGGPPLPILEPAPLAHGFPTPTLVQLVDGTEIRAVRRVKEGDRERLELGPAIRLTASRGCVVWRRFAARDVVTVGHRETLADGTRRRSSTDVTVPP